MTCVYFVQWLKYIKDMVLGMHKKIAPSIFKLTFFFLTTRWGYWFSYYSRTLREQSPKTNAEQNSWVLKAYTFYILIQYVSRNFLRLAPSSMFWHQHHYYYIICNVWACSCTPKVFSSQVMITVPTLIRNIFLMNIVNMIQKDFQNQMCILASGGGEVLIQITEPGKNKFKCQYENKDVIFICNFNDTELRGFPLAESVQNTLVVLISNINVSRSPVT